MRRGQPTPCFRGRLSLLVVGIVLVTMPAFGQATADPWLILVNAESGHINVHTTREDLVRAYGASNVVDQDVGIGEGETEPGTVLFPRDPKRSIEILWKDPDKKTQPVSAQITGDASRWKTVHNISLGTSLKNLERLNGRPFHLSGFGWDYSGTVVSWDHGALAAELNAGRGRLLLRLDKTSDTHVTEAEQSQVLGDGDFSSHNPVMQKLNPSVYQIIWIFPSLAQR